MIRPDFREFKHSNELYHYGVKRRSGRYPWGSGERPFQSVKTKIQMQRLNRSNTGREYNSLLGRQNELFIKTYPRLSKVLKPYLWIDKKITDTAINHYTKVFESSLQKLKESGVELDVDDALKNFGYSTFIGTKYYEKKGD